MAASFKVSYDRNLDIRRNIAIMSSRSSKSILWCLRDKPRKCYRCKNNSMPIQGLTRHTYQRKYKTESRVRTRMRLPPVPSLWFRYALYADKAKSTVSVIVTAIQTYMALGKPGGSPSAQIYRPGYGLFVSREN